MLDLKGANLRTPFSGKEKKVLFKAKKCTSDVVNSALSYAKLSCSKEKQISSARSEFVDFRNCHSNNDHKLSAPPPPPHPLQQLQNVSNPPSCVSQVVRIFCTDFRSFTFKAPVCVFQTKEPSQCSGVHRLTVIRVQDCETDPTHFLPLRRQVDDVAAQTQHMTRPFYKPLSRDHWR